MTVDVNAARDMARAYTAAWNSGDPENVAGFFAEDGEIIINRGDPWTGRSRIGEMAAGFFADVPDLSLTCDDFRLSGTHAVFVWTFTGHDAGTKNPLNVRGWEEWDLGEDLKVRESRGWFDAEEYARQVEGG
ncbi:nuclear transport factor 2 family protein [Thiosulfatihalobacter marinus]|uniref:nuclear transport factor 2 family protein n=1 Tax=Thiosulfatihalobacter marinus TaxID=2792481 RepID=UPI0018D70BB5|nr:SgcJ/EcaC family oxidoreductase [Thiosulfatihalobacter marinus]